MLSLHSILPKPSSLLLLPRRRPSTLFSVSASSDPIPPSSQKPQPKTSSSSNNSKSSELPREKTNSDTFPATIPKKPRRGRRSEAAAVEDFVRDSLEKTFASIRADNSDVLAGKGEIFKDNEVEDEGNDGEEEVGDVGRRRRQVVEEEDPDWPVDSDVGWGVRASEYFEKHPIRNVVEDGMEINWEEEMDDSWVKEINCLEWESFAFHPSPLIVLVFERYNRAADNWKVLKELEAATKVYWGAKDLLPPRTVKIDINIEKDLAYALKVKECPQVLFLKGNKILYREKDFRTADELVKMIAHFYYNAKKPSWIDDAALAPRY